MHLPFVYVSVCLSIKKDVKIKTSKKISKAKIFSSVMREEEDTNQEKTAHMRKLINKRMRNKEGFIYGIFFKWCFGETEEDEKQLATVLKPQLEES